MEQFRLAQHRRFGASSEKSEYDHPGQLNLFNEAEISSDILVPEPELCEVEKHFRKRKRMVSFPQRLPERVTRYISVSILIHLQIFWNKKEPCFSTQLSASKKHSISSSFPD